MKCAALLLATAILPISMAEAQDGGRDYVVSPGIMVHIAQPYPGGTGPSWVMNTQTNVEVDKTSYVYNRKLGRTYATVRLAAVDGHAVIVFDGCAADLGGAGAMIHLTERPAIFKFVNIRSARSPDRPCASGALNFGGAVRLSANANGDVRMDVNWNTYNTRSGLPIDNFSLDNYIIPNRLTPVMAQRKLDQQEQAARDKQREQEQARQELAAKERAALGGDVGAMVDLGAAFESSDPVEAVKWYKMAVAKGSKRAMFQLGLLYHDGPGNLTANDAEAMRYFKMAALAGAPEAAFNVGIMYKKGEGAPASLTEAKKWMRMAAEKGYDDAIQWLKENSFQ